MFCPFVPLRSKSSNERGSSSVNPNFWGFNHLVCGFIISTVWASVSLRGWYSRRRGYKWPLHMRSLELEFYSNKFRVFCNIDTYLLTHLKTFHLYFWNDTLKTTLTLRFVDYHIRLRIIAILNLTLVEQKSPLKICRTHME